VGMSFQLTRAFPFCFGKARMYSQRNGMFMSHNGSYTDNAADGYSDDPDKDGGITFMD
jgi:hypothetical protein